MEEPIEVSAGPEPTSIVLPAVEDQPSSTESAPRHRKPGAGSKRDRYPDTNEPDDSVRREIEHLGRVRRKVGADPARALQLAKEGDREFVDGLLREERAALAIEALVKLGRDDEARKRAGRYLARFPKGPSSERVRSLVADSKAGDKEPN
jgi:hypothetical protein